LNPGIALCLKEISAAGPSKTDEPWCMGGEEVRHFYLAVTGLGEFLGLLSKLVPSGWNRKLVLIEDFLVIDDGHWSDVLRNSEDRLSIRRHLSPSPIYKIRFGVIRTVLRDISQAIGCDE